MKRFKEGPRQVRERCVARYFAVVARDPITFLLPTTPCAGSCEDLFYSLSWPSQVAYNWKYLRPRYTGLKQGNYPPYAQTTGN